MEAVYIVVALALLEYMVFAALVGRARGKFGIRAPATTGHPEFERTYRVHQNTLESLVVFVPAAVLFGLYVSPLWAAVLGVAFIVARAMYAAAYIQAAEKRGPGAGLTGLVNGVLVIGAIVGLVLRLV